MKMKLLLLNILLVVLSSCTGTEEDQNNVKAKIIQSFSLDAKSTGSVQNGLCYIDQYAPDLEEQGKKIDILIVPHTSVGLKEERAKFSTGFESFLNVIPSDIDYRIGVMLAHGPKSPKSGNLFIRDLEPAVLDSQLHSKEAILNGLLEKLKSPAGDGNSDGGEMGLYSLNKGFTSNLSQLKSQGFLRDHAALMVVFISDEQDICFEYPEHLSPALDKEEREVKAKESCYNAKGENMFTAQNVLANLKAANPFKPIQTGAVIYTNNETMPLEGENEIGHGYLEFVNLSGGIIIDLATGEFDQSLERLGKLAFISLDPENTFALKAEDIDLDSLKVLVDGEAANYTYDIGSNEVTLTESRSPSSTARVEYCRKKENPLIATSVITGGMHTCAIYTDGQVKCWGRNDMGQLGLGHTETLGDDETVDQIPYLAIDERVIDLSAGYNHSCAALESGKVLCWGDNSFGQLGLGHTNIIGDDEDLSTATKIDLGEKAIRIYSGYRYNCALLESRSVKCWGENNMGQLGLGHKRNMGDNEDASAFEYLPLNSPVLQMDISTISNHTCAAFVDGDVKCWGNNRYGQLGYGHTKNLGDDETVDTIPSLNFSNKILSLATGYLHTCAIEEGQKVRCWGYNSSGQLGIGMIDILGDDEEVSSLASTAVSDELNMSMVATGTSHSCSIGIDNQVYCWGMGYFGQLGLGHSDNIGDDEVASVENSKVLIDNQKFVQINGGANHTCALEKNEGKVICWGQNNFGQLGLGHTESIGDDESPSEFVSLK